MTRRTVRPALVLLHRWVGLVLAGFLLLAGLTGSLLAWYDELDAALNPALFHVPPGAAPIDPLRLRERYLARHPQVDVAYTPLHVKPGRSLSFFLGPRAGAGPVELANDQVFLDPFSGRVLGERKWGDPSQGRKTLMTFVYRLHYQLALGVVGTWTFGLVALLWTLDCFVGAWLTLPPTARSAARRQHWLARWQPAWRVRWRGGAAKLNFDLHRAGGLWVWAMLFVLAWSSVAFNLGAVYDPVMQAVLTHQPDPRALPRRATPQADPALDWQAARTRGRALMAEQARAHGFTVLREDGLVHDAATGTYRYEVVSDLDLRTRSGDTSVAFDADTGAFLALWRPTGAAAGDTVRTWLTSLHMAAVGGLPMKLFVCAMGLAVALLSVTGVLVWWRRRAARHHRPTPASTSPAPPR